jgi:L-lactate dehydrogenase complex protein LldF
MKRVDHAEASSKFIAATSHIEFHDKRLWDLRQKRDTESQALPEWEQLRELASAIKAHTLTNLADYLEQFERNATANGMVVHWARDAAEHNQIVHDILSQRGVTLLVKSKSMLTDECEMRPYLEQRGVTIVETDLGERIQQLDDEPPSHIVVPAVHKLRADVAEVFGRTIGTDPTNHDVHYLAESQRQHTRSYYLAAGAGMTGANFAVAETGSFVVCTNEGNADLSANLPPLHIASIGIEKLIPKVEHLGVFVRMLSRSALGSPITQITSHFRAPRAGTQMHVVLVDNGRSERLGMADFWYSLKCIRCGACMNTCPVYRRSGGLSYGATYSGPIGVIIDPTFNLRKYSSLPFASTMNGSCTNVCPVKINIHEQIYKWRQIIAERRQLPMVKKEAMRVAGKILGSPRLYRMAVEAAAAGIDHLPRFMIYNPFNAWGRQREVPGAPAQTFRQWYLRNRKNPHPSPLPPAGEGAAPSLAPPGGEGRGEGVR